MTLYATWIVRAGLMAVLSAIAACAAPMPPEDPPGPPAGPDAEEPEAPTGPAVLDFDHAPPGALIPETGHRLISEGYTGPEVNAPDMRFPMVGGPAYANSQIFNPVWGSESYNFDGVSYPRPQGWEYTASNYDYPWRDNFCEVRTRGNGACPGGHGHEGQDIRPSTCSHDNVAAAAEDGIVDVVSTLTVDIIGDSGRTYRYLHLDRPLEPGIADGVRVDAGDPIGRVSNISGGTDASPSRLTTIHLHFEIWDGTPRGSAPLSPYTSLVEAYRRLGGQDPSHHAAAPAIGDCSYPDGGLP